ncbi:LOW QUALITY PROTEIN: hypothetical protein Smp_183490 [Schistosoma mansoni]|uniref:hypothetical protein n=1 Tax=Schistosoma mansoni TaxID=6183 RepID=UPI00022DCA11|nr:LOW QUALITY PROTEIN: hypothetical protein Smp_183490 [Schistosoma mansoni]|eukprot:XP_018654480.1 LOW QUALITY PROTEIN: hypothetical protein Smp_183490 [Schistosoma mansoni]
MCSLFMKKVRRNYRSKAGDSDEEQSQESESLYDEAVKEITSQSKPDVPVVYLINITSDFICSFVLYVCSFMNEQYISLTTIRLITSDCVCWENIIIPNSLSIVCLDLPIDVFKTEKLVSL